MVSDPSVCARPVILPLVLILVLMEDGLGLSNRCLTASTASVLILVLMEDGLGRADYCYIVEVDES